MAAESGCHSFLVDMIEGIDGIDHFRGVTKMVLPGAEFFGKGVLDW